MLIIIWIKVYGYGCFGRSNIFGSRIFFLYVQKGKKGFTSLDSGAFCYFIVHLLVMYSKAIAVLFLK